MSVISTKEITSTQLFTNGPNCPCFYKLKSKTSLDQFDRAKFL